MNNPILPHPSAIIKLGFEYGLQHLSLLIKFSVLYGLLTSIVTAPASEFISHLIGVLQNDAGDGQSTTQFFELEDMLTFMLGQIFAFVIQATLLVMWSRTISMENLTLFDGGFDAFVKRSKNSFTLIIKATLVSALIAILAGIIIYTLSSVLGPIGFVVTISGVILAACLVVLVDAVAYFAVFNEARDNSLTLIEAWLIIKPAAFPIFVTSVVYLFIALFANLMINIAMGDALLAAIPHTTAAINNGFHFAASAFFVAALCRLNLL